MPVTDEEVVTGLRQLLKNVDKETTTERKLRQTLESQFNEDLTSKKHVIGEEVKRYLAEAEALAAAEDGEDDDDDDDDSAEGSNAGTKGGKSGRSNAPVKKKRKVNPDSGSRLSPELSAFLGGVERMGRFQVVKQLWVYIKANNLQDPACKRRIIPDEKMLTIFTPPLDQFSLNKQLSRHILPKDPNDPPPQSAKKAKKDDDGSEKKAPSGFTKPVRVSPELSSWLGGATEISRPQLTSAFWKYVKENGLQDPANKSNILADAKLKELTGESEFKGFSFQKLIGGHLFKD